MLYLNSLRMLSAAMDALKMPSTSSPMKSVATLMTRPTVRIHNSATVSNSQQRSATVTTVLRVADHMDPCDAGALLPQQHFFS